MTILQRGLYGDVFRHLQGFDLDERDQADDGSKSIFYKDVAVYSHYFVMKGVLKDMNFLKFADWESLATVDPTAILSAPQRLPDLYKKRGQRAKECLEMESLIGDPNVATKFGLLRDGQPLIRFSRLLIVSTILQTFLSRSESGCRISDRMINMSQRTVLLAMHTLPRVMASLSVQSSSNEAPLVFHRLSRREVFLCTTMGVGYPSLSLFIWEVL